MSPLIPYNRSKRTPMQTIKKIMSATGLAVLLMTVPVIMSARSAKENEQRFSGPASTPLVSNIPVVEEAAMIYDSLQLDELGLSKEAFEYAWKGYQRLAEQGKIIRKDVLSICDFSQSSRKKRLYIIDIADFKILHHTYVAHGRNSGGEYAQSFSNSPESHKSSLGFYVTKATYQGGHGLSLRIDGLEKGINDKAMNRSIVIHGSDYVTERFIAGYKFAGRSFGCPAVPSKENKKVINLIKGGSLLFIYHPDKRYLQQSKILQA
jgi:hypothetical protein